MGKLKVLMQCSTPGDFTLKTSLPKQAMSPCDLRAIPFQKVWGWEEPPTLSPPLSTVN